MTVTTNATAKAITLTFTDVEWSVLLWAVNRHGADVIKDGFRQWLKNWWGQQENERLQTLTNPMPTELK